jgi:hypothetical protein
MEVGNIPSGDVAGGWAHEALTVKNSLTARDARLVEDAFEQRLSELPSSDATAVPNDESPVAQTAAVQPLRCAHSDEQTETARLD